MAAEPIQTLRIRAGPEGCARRDGEVSASRGGRNSGDRVAIAALPGGKHLRHYGLRAPTDAAWKGSEQAIRKPQASCSPSAAAAAAAAAAAFEGGMEGFRAARGSRA